MVNTIQFNLSFRAPTVNPLPRNLPESIPLIRFKPSGVNPFGLHPSADLGIGKSPPQEGTHDLGSRDFRPAKELLPRPFQGVVGDLALPIGGEYLSDYLPIDPPFPKPRLQGSQAFGMSPQPQLDPVPGVPPIIDKPEALQFIPRLMAEGMDLLFIQIAELRRGRSIWFPGRKEKLLFQLADQFTAGVIPPV